jgi:hypothetical protein
MTDRLARLAAIALAACTGRTIATATIMKAYRRMRVISSLSPVARAVGAERGIVWAAGAGAAGSSRGAARVTGGTATTTAIAAASSSGPHLGSRAGTG